MSGNGESWRIQYNPSGCLQLVSCSAEDFPSINHLFLWKSVIGYCMSPSFAQIFFCGLVKMKHIGRDGKMNDVFFVFTFLAQRIPCKTQHSQKKLFSSSQNRGCGKNRGLEDEFSLQNGSFPLPWLLVKEYKRGNFQWLPWKWKLSLSLRKVNLSKTKVSTIFGGPLGDKRECLRVSVKTNKHSHRSHWIFSRFSFLEWFELEVFDFFKGEKLRKTGSFHLERLQSERNKRKYIRRGIPFPLLKVWGPTCQTKPASSRKKNPHPKKHTEHLSGSFVLKTLRKARLMWSLHSPSHNLRFEGWRDADQFWANYCTMRTQNLHF